MFLHHPTHSSDGIAVSHHRVVSAAIRADFSNVEIAVESWPSEKARIAGGPPVARWHLLAPCAGLSLAQGLRMGLLNAVLLHEAFAGATPLPDAATSITGARMRKAAEISAERERRLQGTFISGGREFDLRRSANLSNAVLDAVIAQSLGEAFSQFWVLADDTSAQLTAAETIAAGRTAKRIITGLWQTSQALRARIDAVTTIAQVDAVTWP